MAAVVSRDGFRLRIHASFQFRPDDLLVFAREEETEIVKGVIASIESDLAAIAAESPVERLLIHRREMELLLNTALRLPGSGPSGSSGNHTTVTGLPEERTRLHHLLEERGNDRSRLERLYGIEIAAFQITAIEFADDVRSVLEATARAERQREGEKAQISHLIGIIQTLKNVLPISDQQAIELVQTERGNVSKKLTEFKLTTSDEVIAAVQQLIDRIH